MANLTKFEDLDIPALTLVAQEQYEECLWAIEKALAKQLEFGRVLLIVKAKLPHGEWGSWVRETFADHKSLRTIQRHMRGAEAIATDPSLLECADSLDGILKIVEARKPSVEVIEVAAEIVAADMPAVEVVPVASVKPVATDKPVAAQICAKVEPVVAKPAKPAKPQPVAPAEDPPEFDLEEATDRLTKVIDDELFNWPGSAIQDGSEGVQWLWRQIELCLTSWTRPPETSWPRIAASAANAESPADGNPQSSLTDN